MTREEMIQALKRLAKKWEERIQATEGDWYNDCGSIAEFLDDIGDILAQYEDETT